MLISGHVTYKESYLAKCDTIVPNAKKFNDCDVFDLTLLKSMIVQYNLYGTLLLLVLHNKMLKHEHQDLKHCKKGKMKTLLASHRNQLAH